MYNIIADGRQIYEPTNQKSVLLSPKLTLELGKTGALEFDIPKANRYYSTLKQLKTKISVSNDEEELFRGRILSFTRDINDTRKVYVEGDLSYLIDTVQTMKSYKGKASALFRIAIDAHNKMTDDEKKFKVGIIEIEGTENDLDVTVSGKNEDIESIETRKDYYKQIALNAMSGEWDTTMDFIENNLIDYCGGYLRTRRETKVFNIWDEEWTLVKDGNNQRVQSKNHIPLEPDVEYYLKTPNGVGYNITYFDKDGHAIGQDAQIDKKKLLTSDSKYFITSDGKYYITANGALFTSPSGVASMNITLDASYGTVYKHDVCINKSQPNTAVSPHNGDYLPSVGTYIDWVKEYHNTCSQIIKIGKNMIDLEEEIASDDLFTVLIPLGDENLTIEKVNNGNKELVDTEAVAKYGRIVKTHVFDSVTSADTLKENGEKYLREKLEVPITITVTAIDLHLLNKGIQPIHLGDTVTVQTGIPEFDEANGSLTCTKIEYDLADPSKNVYTFGKAKQTLNDRYRKDKKSQSSSYGGYAGGGGAIAAEVETETQVEEKKLKDFFDAWVKVDEGSGIVDIKGIYTKYMTYSNKEDFTNECGIYINPKTSSGPVLNLTVMQDDVNNGLFNQKENNKAISSILNYLDIDSEGHAQASHIDLKTQLNDAIAQIAIRSGYRTLDDGSLAKDENGKLIPISTIVLDSDLTTIKGRLDAVEANFNKLSADTGNIDWINSGVLSAAFISGYKRVYGAVISGNEINIVNENGGVPSLSLSSHKHSLVVKDDGTIEQGGPISGNNDWSFKIADTKFYKDRVSALTPVSAGFGIDSDNGLDYGHIILYNSTGNRVGNTISAPTNSDGENAYEIGRRIGRSLGTNSKKPISVAYDIGDDGDTLWTKINVTSYDGSITALDLNVNAYELGKNSVFISSIYPVSSNANDRTLLKYYGNIWQLDLSMGATTSNNVSNSFNNTIYFNASSIINSARSGYSPGTYTGGWYDVSTGERIHSKGSYYYKVQSMYLYKKS